MRWIVGAALLAASTTGWSQQAGQPQEQADLLSPMELRELARSTTQMRDILRDLSYLMDREEMARQQPATDIAAMLDAMGDTLGEMARRIRQGSADPAQREDINQRLTSLRQQLQELERHRVGP